MRFHQKIYRHELFFRRGRLSERYSYREGVRNTDLHLTLVRNIPRFERHEFALIQQLLDDRNGFLEVLTHCSGRLAVLPECELVVLVEETVERVDIDGDTDERYCNLLKVVVKSRGRGFLVHEKHMESGTVADVASVLTSAVERYSSRSMAGRKDTRGRRLAGGRRLILPPRSAGGFFHETIGHLLEQDVRRYCETELAQRRIDSCITYTDDIRNHEHLVGLNRLDDEGTPIRPAVLVSEGRLIGGMGTHQYNDGTSGDLAGFARSESFLKGVYPRMRMSIVAPAETSQEIPYGPEDVLLDNVHHGSVIPSLYRFVLQGSGYVLSGGEKVGLLPDVVVSGGLFTALNEIPYIGSDIDYFASDCGKRGQSVRVGYGAPTIMINAEDVCGELIDV